MTLLNRRDVVRELLRERGDLIVVAGLGSSAYDVAACGDEALDFPLWGGMGGAAMLGMGLALAQPQRRVLVLTGDGEMLMGVGSLATIGAQRPSNLSIVVLDNELYGETGRQPTHTAMGTNLAPVASGCGISHTRVVRATSELSVLRSDLHTLAGPLFAVVKVSADDVPRVMPPREGAFLTHRIRAALLGPKHAMEA